MNVNQLSEGLHTEWQWQRYWQWDWRRCQWHSPAGITVLKNTFDGLVYKFRLHVGRCVIPIDGYH